MSLAAFHILVLEDEPAAAALVETALREAGFTQISTSSSIAGARQCWHAQIGKFDLVVTDLSLPDGLAPEFIQELLRYKPRLRVILMSGPKEPFPALEGEWTQSVSLLQKPILPLELRRLVRTAFEAVAAEKSRSPK